MCGRKFVAIDKSLEFVQFRMLFCRLSLPIYYPISGRRRLVPSLEVEEDADWNICGQFCGKGWLFLNEIYY